MNIETMQCKNMDQILIEGDNYSVIFTFFSLSKWTWEFGVDLTKQTGVIVLPFLVFSYGID